MASSVTKQDGNKKKDRVITKDENRIPECLAGKHQRLCTESTGMVSCNVASRHASTIHLNGMDEGSGNTEKATLRE